MNKILLVDDQENILMALKMVLKSDDNEIVTVKNGREAIEKLENDSFDLMITDIFMPDIDGMELVEFVRSAEDPLCNMPIIAISGGHPVIFADVALESMQSRVECVLKKPFKKSDILDAVAKVLGGDDTQMVADQTA